MNEKNATPNNKTGLLTVQDCARLLNASPRTVQRLLERGDLLGVRLGTGRASWRIPSPALDRFVRKFSDLDPAEVLGLETRSAS